VLTRQEKEKLVIDLYNQGKTIRDIAKELRMSFRDIGAILRKASGEDEEIQDEKHSLSPSTKAYHLFSKSKTPLQVAIALDLTESETAKYYEEYLDLKQMHELKVVHEELGGDIGDFLKLYRLSKAARMSPEHVVKLLQITNEYLPVLEMKYKRLTKEIDSLEFEKQRLQYMGNQVRVLTKVLEKCKGEVKNLRKEKTKLSTLIAKLKNCNEYKRIRQAAEEEVTNSLSKRRDLLKLAVSSVFESMIKDPDKYRFLVSSGFYNGQYAASQPYIDVYRALILDQTQKIFELMVRDLTGRIINEAALTIHHQTM
jgi:hypothetical protein